MCHFICILTIKLCTRRKVWANIKNMEVLIKYTYIEIFKYKAAYKICEINIWRNFMFCFSTMTKRTTRFKCSIIFPLSIAYKFLV